MDDSSSVQDASYINDIRHASEFKGVTFSKYKKTEVRHAFLDNLLKGKIEPTCYWCTELLCAGHFMDVWELLLYFVGKHIHLGNPKLAVYLDSRYTIFRNIMENALYTHELQLRNNATMRQLFAEIVSIVALSPRKHSLETLNLPDIEAFDLNNQSDKLKAPDTTLIEEIFLKEDPKELFIAINELAFQLTQNGGNIMACYWIEWLVKFDAYCRKKDEPCLCERRAKIPVSASLQKDAVWMVWEVLTKEAGRRGAFVTRAVEALQNLFCIKYTWASCRKRKYLLYFAVGLLTEHVPMHVPMVSNKTVVDMCVSQINEIYREVKENEDSPDTNYLFDNQFMERDSGNMEKSLRKLEMLQGMYPKRMDEV